MPALARRDPTAPPERWRVHCRDVLAGIIAQCVGNPGAGPRWAMAMRLLSRSGAKCTSGIPADFDPARAD
jgi:hypothetical protein